MMATSDVSERKSTARSGWVFADGFIAIAILLVGAFVLVWLSAGVGHPLLTAVLSYLGSCLVAFLPILGIFAAVVHAKLGGEEPDVTPLVHILIYLAAAILGAGVYYAIHNVVGVPSLVSLSELLGGLVVFGGAWMVLVTILERREMERREKYKRRLP